MTEEWLTYSDLGERLGISSEAARQKAIRARWPRRLALDGRAQVQVDLEAEGAASATRRRGEDAPSDARPEVITPPSNASMLDALERHIQTLKAVAETADGALVRERQRADAERARADGLEKRLEEAQERMAQRTDLERQLSVLRNQLAEMRDAQARSWWRRLTR